MSYYNYNYLLFFRFIAIVYLYIFLFDNNYNNLFALLYVIKYSFKVYGLLQPLA